MFRHGRIDRNSTMDSPVFLGRMPFTNDGIVYNTMLRK
jgi:hypothetical protein